jgi:predicted transposase/invertase (TIGR01784 family)
MQIRRDAIDAKIGRNNSYKTRRVGMFDNVSKFLVERYSADFATWLLGESIELTTLSPTELSLEPIRADALILLQSDDVVLHCEFQTNTSAKIPFRMADYRLRVYRRFPQKRMVQVVIYLRPTDSPLAYETAFRLENLECRFNVVRIWEVEPEVLLATPGLLPYAVLSRTDAPEGMLRQVVSRLEQLPNSASKNDLMAATSILGGLKLEGDTIRRVIRSEMMRESVIYQEIVQESELKQAQSLILRQLNRRVGNLSLELETRVKTLPLVRLEELGEALLDFSQVNNLVAWLDVDRS